MQLADQYPCRLISVDSSMVYCGMDIGTAKPSGQELERFPHDLVNIREPQDTYSVGEFVVDARNAILDARAAGRIPILVGGTLLYYRGLFQGLAELPKADADLRHEIELDAGRVGWAGLHQRLERVDPAAAAAIAINDQQRIQRALEVYQLTGKPISYWQSQPRSGAVKANVLKIILSPPQRQTLHQLIAARSQQMIDSGLVAEVSRLGEIQAEGGPLAIDELPAMRAVGYRQVLEHLRGEILEVDLAQRITIATRQLAKRQLTWLRSDPAGVWLDPGSTKLLKRVAGLVDQHLGCYG